jgi:hypothetical protein
MVKSYKKIFINEETIELDLRPTNTEVHETYDIIIMQSEGKCTARINLSPCKQSLSKVMVKIFAENNASVNCVCTLRVDKDVSDLDTDVQFRSWPFDRSRVQARPEMFIKNGNIKAAHGNALGTLNAEDQYYLNSRGIVDYKEIIKRSLLDEG